jgi:phage baseplate assembly protein W
MSRRTETIYSDLRGDLAINPANDDILLQKNEDSIKTSIINLLNTDRGERLMQPRIGSNIRALLFELNTPQTAFNLREMIYETIDTFEPRCNLIEVAIEDDADRNAYNCYITYSTQVRETPQTIDVILSRVR